MNGNNHETAKILCTIILAIALYTAGGYFEGGFTLAYSRAGTMVALVFFAVAIYFGAARFVENHLDTLLITGAMLIREPEISKKSVAQIEREAKEMKQSIKTIRKILH